MTPRLSAPDAPAEEHLRPNQQSRSVAFAGAMFGRVKQGLKVGVLLSLAACSPHIGGSFSAPPVERSIGGVPVTIAPLGASAAEKIAHYQALVQAAGGQWRPGRVHLIALRGFDLDSQTIHSTRSNPTFDDTLVVAGWSRDGQPFVREFAGSTRPGQSSTTAMSPDVSVNGVRDGIRDVGMLAPGNFNARSNGIFDPNPEDDLPGAPSYHFTLNGSTHLPGYRDTNQDGVYSAAEIAYSQAQGHTVGDILLHTPLHGRVVSIACFNARDLSAVINALGGPSANFNVTLLDASGAPPP